MTDPGRALAGRREIALLECPSVRRMADLLGVRCREPSWVRMLVSGLDRFRTMTGTDDLERLLEGSRGDVAIADRTLLRFAAALHDHPDTAVAALAMGPKVWFRLNDVPVSWRPLPAVRSAPPVPSARTRPDRLALLALIGSGLAMSELLRLRVGDVGSLDREARLIPDPEAEPLAVQHTPRRDWELATGPRVLGEDDLWTKIDADLDRADVPAAAHRLRRRRVTSRRCATRSGPEFDSS